MKEILTTAIIFSLMQTGIFIATQPGMLLGKPIGMFDQWLSMKLRQPVYEIVRKPLYACLQCMASFWTIVFYCIAQPHEFIYLIPLIFCICGLNTLMRGIINPLIEP
jgi:hypothetical protein